MNRSRIVAFALGAIWLVVAAGGLVLASANRAVGADFASVVYFTAIGLCYLAVGVLIVARRRHPIGWLLLAIAVGLPAAGAAEQYVLRSVVAAPGSLPATTAAALSVSWLFAVVTTSLTLLLLTFPTGTVRSRRWRPLVIAAPIATLVYAIPFTIRPIHGPWDNRGVHLVNPLGLTSNEQLVVVFGIGIAASLVISVAGVVSLVLRFRASHGVERQQVKWLAYVGIAAGLILIVNFAIGAILGPGPECSRSYCGPRDILWMVFFFTLMFGIPISVGAAILRYRLFDIDRIISRTLTYALITAVLLGVYALIVLLPTALIGGGQAPSWLIAAATLVAAALFRPVRRRIQDAIDHRFNRARYDAQHTIDTFTAHLRDEVDIDALGAELASVVNSAMRPAHISLWIRSPGA